MADSPTFRPDTAKDALEGTEGISAPDHIIEEGDGHFAVWVGSDVAGYVSEDTESLGFWVAEDAEGQFMGQHLTREASAAFLAASFAAKDQDRS